MDNKESGLLTHVDTYSDSHGRTLLNIITLLIRTPIFKKVKLINGDQLLDSTRYIGDTPGPRCYKKVTKPLVRIKEPIHKTSRKQCEKKNSRTENLEV